MSRETIGILAIGLWHHRKELRESTLMADAGRGVEEIHARRFGASTVAEYVLWENEKRL